MTIEDLMRAMQAPPDWLGSAWARAKRRGLDTMTLQEINDEIDAYRREKESADNLGKLDQG